MVQKDYHQMSFFTFAYHKHMGDVKYSEVKSVLSSLVWTWDRKFLQIIMDFFNKNKKIK